MRAFFCIPIDSEQRQRIRRIASQLRDTTEMRASWVALANYHLTVRFLGDIEPAWIPDLEAVARAACASIKPTGALGDRIGAFPKLENARVLWIGGQAPDGLRSLSMSLNQELEAMGFPRDRVDRGFHVTMARIKGRPDPLLSNAVEALGAFAPFWFPVEQLTLMESTLTSQGAEYASLFTVPIGSAVK